MFRIFLFLLIFTPLAFGTVEPWSYAVMEILSFLALSMFVVGMARKRDPFLSVPGIVPLLFFLAYILFQTIPLPPQLVKFLSPAAYELHSTILAVSDSNQWMTISVHPSATLREFFRWATYVAFYVLTIQLLKRNDRIRKTIFTIAIFGALLSFSSILQFYLTDDIALWFRHVPKNGMIVGPYICHNHYAGLMEMMFPVVLALFFFYRPRTRSRSFLKGVAEILSQKRANIHILIGAAALLIGTSIFVSLSRGGMLSMCFSLIFFTCLVFKRKINRAHATLIAGIVLLTALSVGWFGWDHIFERFSQLKKVDGTLYDGRIDIWKDSLNIFKDFSITGAGIGTFSDIYPAYKSILRDHFVNYAHNDYLELAIEGGIFSLLLAVCFIFSISLKSYRMFLNRRDAFAVYMYMGSITGIIALLIHSVVDFNLHVGANGLWFFFLCGLAVSSSATPMRGRTLPSRLATIRSPSVKALAVAAVFIMLIATAGYNFSTLTGSFYFSHISDTQTDTQTPKTDLKRIEKIARYATMFDPLNGTYANAKASASLYLGNEVSTLENLKKAIRLNPTNSYYLARLGNIYAGKGLSETADRLLSAAVRVDIFNAEYTLRYGAWLLSQSRMEEGLAQIKRALEIDRGQIDNALLTMAINRVGDDKMRTAIPDLPEAVIAYAEFLNNMGKTEAAESQYFSAMSSIENQDKFNRNTFFRIYNFFKNRGNTTEAMRVILRASELLPNDVWIRITLGDLYRDMGITYRAEEEYQQALLVSPGNKSALRRLEKLGTFSP